MRRWYVWAGSACALTLVVLATVGAVRWVDERGDEFIAQRVQGGNRPGEAPGRGPPAADDAQTRANAYSAAAAYLNFNYGFPVGVLTALIGGGVTALGGFLGWRLTSRQGDVEILKFIEEKIDPAIRHQQQLTTTMGDLLDWGNQARKLAMTLKAQIEQEGGLSSSPTFALLIAIGEAFDNSEDVRAPIKVTEPSETRELADAAVDTVLALYQLTARLEDVFANVTGNMYSYFFCRIEAKTVNEAHRPLRLLADRLPDTAREYPSLFGATLPDLAVSLSYFANATRPAHLVGAAYSLPKDNLTLEFIGHVIFSLSATPYHLVERQDAMTARYNYNFGAAYLITLLQAMPRKATIVSAFEEMFGDRSAVAKQFIEAAVPEKIEMGPSTIFGSLTESLTNPGRLITAEVLIDGPQSLSVRGEFYRPDRHGVAPAVTELGKAKKKKDATLASRALLNSKLG